MIADLVNITWWVMIGAWGMNLWCARNLHRPTRPLSGADETMAACLHKIEQTERFAGRDIDVSVSKPFTFRGERMICTISREKADG